ncbi:MAG: hypothetical protein IPQ07_33765 [Myxococcales bacterium]|nr:hypothetical protein [Myxococcales bacterium]
MFGIRLTSILPLAVVAVVVLGGGLARAETPAAGDAVALLPLDADQRLEIYGQPVASELARALAAGGVDVVVIGPKMAVPQRAKLIVDGTISANKADLVTLTLRVRNPVDGTTLASTQATAQGLPNIDKAAAELSAKILPIVNAKLEAMHRPIDRTPPPPVDHHDVVVAPDPLLPLLFTLAGNGNATTPLRIALETALTPWAERHHHLAKTPTIKNQKVTPASVKSVGAALGMAFEIKRFSITGGTIPIARARVHVKVTDATTVLFDRVVITDSVVGDKGLSRDALAARTAREVLDILRPHLHRLVATWQ